MKQTARSLLPRKDLAVWAGAPGGNRTPDAALRTRSLYPLSYRGRQLLRAIIAHDALHGNWSPQASHPSLHLAPGRQIARFAMDEKRGTMLLASPGMIVLTRPTRGCRQSPAMRGFLCARSCRRALPRCWERIDNSQQMLILRPHCFRDMCMPVLH